MVLELEWSPRTPPVQFYRDHLTSLQPHPLLFLILSLYGSPISILSSSIEYLLARLYNSSIVPGGSKDSDWKKRVDGPKLLLKFWRTASMIYDFICWMACPNIIVKSRIDSSSCLRIVCKRLMFLFCSTEQRYCDTNAAHSSLNKFIELCGSL